MPPYFFLASLTDCFAKTDDCQALVVELVVASVIHFELLVDQSVVLASLEMAAREISTPRQVRAVILVTESLVIAGTENVQREASATVAASVEVLSCSRMLVLASSLLDLDFAKQYFEHSCQLRSSLLDHHHLFVRA